MASLALAFEILAKDRASREFDNVGRAAENTGRKADAAGKSGGRFGAAIKGAAIAGAAALAAAGIGQKLTEIVNAGSNLQQNLGGAEAVFKQSFGGIDAAAKAAANSLGLSRSEYLQLSTVLGAGLKNKGLKDFAGQTQNLVKIGADLAAQYGGSTQEAVDALASAMRGESDPIERYGVSLNETAVNAELAAKGQSKLTGAALEQAKAQARIAILTRQSADATGAYAREADTFAGKQQRLGASVQNLKEKLGIQLLPVLTKVTGFFLQSLPTIEAWGKSIGEFAGKAATGVRALFDLFVKGDFTGGFSKIFGLEEDSDTVGRLFTIRDAVMSAFGQVSSFITGSLVPAFLSVVTSVQGYATTVLPIIRAVSEVFLERIRPLLPEVLSTFGQIGQYVVATLGLMRNVIAGVTAVISAIWSRWGDQILAVVRFGFDTTVGIIRGALAVIRGIIQTVTALITGDWSGAWEGIKTIVSGAMGIVQTIISSAFTAIAALFRAGWGALTGIVSDAWERVKTAVTEGVSAAGSAVAALPGVITDAVGDLGNLLYDVGRDLVQGLINGIKDMVGNVASAAAGVVGSAIDAAKEKLKVRSPSRVFMEIGQNTGKGLAIGLDQSQGTVEAASRRMAASIVNPTASLSVGGSAATGSAAGVGASWTVISNGPTAEDVAREVDEMQRRKANLSLVTGFA